jgi:exodeoxyribonuclease VII large subunit
MMSQSEFNLNDLMPARPLSIWELTAQVKDLLEAAFPGVWVTGEISNFSRPQSGHCYLTLKDDRAQLKAAIWRPTAARVRFEMHDGLEVVCRGRLEVYAPRGTYQLIIEEIEPKGMGALDLARKRPLPSFVQQIAVVTSPTGAAIRDFLQVLARRWRGANVLIVPVRVQGEGAAEEIAAAIAAVNQFSRPIDCLVVTRGGGSLEDLWAFNEEVVIRAIAASRIPVISAVGHEIDVTLSDLAADVRALTPSEAAELVAPAAEELFAQLTQMQKRMSAALRSRATGARSRLDALARHALFRRPFQRIFDLVRQVDELSSRTHRAMRQRLQLVRQQTETLAGRLNSLSPLAVLGRGYSLTERLADGQVVRAAAQLTPGEQISTRFARGRSISRVEDVEE